MFCSRRWYTPKKQFARLLQAHALEAILIGYARCSRGYKLWSPSKRIVTVSPDVSFTGINDTLVVHVDEAANDTKGNGTMEMAESETMDEPSACTLRCPGQSNLEPVEEPSTAPVVDSVTDDQHQGPVPESPQLRQSTRDRFALPRGRVLVDLFTTTPSEPLTFQQPSFKSVLPNRHP